MSLTQEQIKIARELFYSHPANEPVETMFNLFLSRIREEQEPVAWMQTDPVNPSFLKAHPSGKGPGALWTIPLFTIPPASDPKEHDCKELVEALETALNYIRWVGANYTEKGLPHPQQLLINNAEEALAKWKGEK